MTKYRSAELTLKELRTGESFEALVPDWSDLWRRCPSASPFQTPEWLLPWWRHFGNGELRVLAFFAGSRLTGLAPFFIHREKGSGATLRPVGTGISDYLDPLIEPENALTCAGMILSYARQNDRGWDDCETGQLAANSPLLNSSIEGTTISVAEVCPLLSLPDSTLKFDAGLPAEHRRKLRRAQRLMEQHGQPRFELASELTVLESMEILFRLHQARWASRSLPGVLAEDKIKKFHTEAALGLVRRGSLRLRVLWLYENPAAVLYAMAGSQRTYAYLGGFDPALQHMSPGTLLTNYAIQEAIREGHKEYDFLRGQESHKYFWRAQDRTTYHLRIEVSKSS